MALAALAAGAALTSWVALAHGVRRLTLVLVAALVPPPPSSMLSIWRRWSRRRVSCPVCCACRRSCCWPFCRGPVASLAPPLVRLAWVTAGCYLAAVGLTVNTAGGKDVGPRLIIGLWPLLAAAAVETLSTYVVPAARHSWSARGDGALGRCACRRTPW